MRPNIVVLKVHRNAAGQTIPFDKIYFFRRQDKELIPTIFTYALVLPIDEQLLSALYKLKPKEFSHLKYKRDDETKQQPVLMPDRQQLDGRKHSPEQIQQWWTQSFIEEYDLDNRVAVVPILAAKARKKLIPRYLSTKKWFDKQMRSTSRFSRYGSSSVKPKSENLKPAISELGYLSTPKPAPNDKIRPICSICPRMMQHLQGQCIPGQIVCYKSLNLNMLDEYEKQEAAE